MLVWTADGHREALDTARRAAAELETGLVWTEQRPSGAMAAGGGIGDRIWSAPLGKAGYYLTIEDAGRDRYMGRHATQGDYCWSILLKRAGAGMVPEILAGVIVGAPPDGLGLAQRSAARWIAWLAIPDVVKSDASGPESLADDWLEVLATPPELRALPAVPPHRA